MGSFELKKYYAVGTPTANYSGMNWAITRHLQYVLEHDIREYCVKNNLSKDKYKDLVHSTYASFNLIPVKNVIFKTPSDAVTYFKHPVEHNFKENEPTIYAALCATVQSSLDEGDIITDAYRAANDMFDTRRRKSLRYYPMRSDVMWIFYGLYQENRT